MLWTFNEQPSHRESERGGKIKHKVLCCVQQSKRAEISKNLITMLKHSFKRWQPLYASKVYNINKVESLVESMNGEFCQYNLIFLIN